MIGDRPHRVSFLTLPCPHRVSAATSHHIIIIRLLSTIAVVLFPAAGATAFAGCRKGVPLGGDLSAAPEGAEAPTFTIHAVRDPFGANPDRIQIIKNRLGADSETREQVHDVAWSGGRKPDAEGKLPSVGDTVGAPERGAVWSDPDFDPAQRAFYYARVIAIPTPRRTAYDAFRFDLDLPKKGPHEDAGTGRHLAHPVHPGAAVAAPERGTRNTALRPERRLRARYGVKSVVSGSPLLMTPRRKPASSKLMPQSSTP